MKVFGWVLVGFVLFITGVQIGIAHGRGLGYEQGWSDANCGPGRVCEAGQE